MGMDPTDPLLGLTKDQLQELADAADVPQRLEILRQQLAQARASGQPSGVRHTTGAGAALGGMADILNGLFSRKKEETIQEQIAAQQGTLAKARQALSRLAIGDIAPSVAGGPPPGPQQGIPPMLARPPDQPAGGSLLTNSIRAMLGGQAPSEAPPLAPVDPEAQQRTAYANALRGGGQPPAAQPQDASAGLRRKQALARLAMLSGDPIMAKFGGAELENSRHLLQTEMERSRYAAGQQETGRHNLAMEGIDRDKLAQDQWTHVVDPITDEAYLLNKRTGQSRPLITEQQQGAAGSGQGPNGAPAIPTEIPLREPGEAPAPTPAPQSTRAQQIEAHKWKKLAPETRKRIEDTESSLQNIRDSLEAVQKYPGAFGILEQAGDLAPGFSIGGVNPLSAVSELLNAPARQGRTSQEDEARATVLRSAGETLHALSGAAVTTSEAARFRAFIPNANDSAPEILSKLRSAEKMAGKQLDKLYQQNGFAKPPYQSAPDRLRAPDMALQGGKKKKGKMETFLDAIGQPPEDVESYQ